MRPSRNASSASSCIIRENNRLKTSEEKGVCERSEMHLVSFCILPSTTSFEYSTNNVSRATRMKTRSFAPISSKRTISKRKEKKRRKKENKSELNDVNV